MTDRYAPNIGLPARQGSVGGSDPGFSGMNLSHLEILPDHDSYVRNNGRGVFLGLIKEFGSSPRYDFFFPWPSFFPSGFIFFEKARTIARNIGFIRIQEKLCVSGSPDALLGFETAMRRYGRTRKRGWILIPG